MTEVRTFIRSISQCSSTILYNFPFQETVVMLRFSDCCVCDLIDKGEESFVPSKGQPQPAVKKSAANEHRAGVAPERARLQEFVKDFAKCAIRGVPCHVVNPQTGHASGASYFLDPKISRLVFKRSQTPETVIANIQMENIKDVLVDSGVSEKVISKHDVNRLAILTFQNGDPSVFILEGSQVDRDRFALCVKILRLYAQMQQGTA
eukprot:s2917_g4.t1